MDGFEANGFNLNEQLLPLKTMQATSLKLQIAEPPAIPPTLDYDPLRMVIVGFLHRHEQSVASEGCLSACKTKVEWDIEGIGKYTISIDTMELNTTQGLFPDEISLLKLWTNHGINRLLGY